MTHIHIFADGSVNTTTKRGCGAVLILTDLEEPLEQLAAQIQLFYCVDTASTQMELQTLLWALTQVVEAEASRAAKIKVKIYSDCQNIIGLPGRQARLEQQQFKSAKNVLLSQHLLYREFYRLTSILNCEFIKVSGHRPERLQDKIGKLFQLVDKAARHGIRGINV